MKSFFLNGHKACQGQEGGHSVIDCRDLRPALGTRQVALGPCGYSVVQERPHNSSIAMHAVSFKKSWRNLRPQLSAPCTWSSWDVEMFPDLENLRKLRPQVWQNDDNISLTAVGAVKFKQKESVCSQFFSA